ncbi:MAG: hypothetical protein AAF387_08035 [Pseudomonadota bacterium]
MKVKVITVLVTALLISACSSIPFVGGDEDDEKPAAKKKEKIKTTLVYIPKGELQCEDDSGDPVKATKARLVASGISVYSSECAKIAGMMHPSMCGEVTLDINVHSINETYVEQAQKLGFELIETLEDKDLDYDVYPCDL